MKSAEFKPNSIKTEDIESLDDWQLLVAACHFGQKMGDCVDLDYSYTIDDGELFCGSISLNGDIDIDNPMKAITEYCEAHWQDVAKHFLLGRLVK